MAHGLEETAKQKLRCNAYTLFSNLNKHFKVLGWISHKVNNRFIKLQPQYILSSDILSSDFM